MAYGLEPKRIFWWAHQTEDGQTRLSWVTIRRVDHWHGRITFDDHGELQETEFSQLEVTLFRYYPVWDPERGCYLADRAAGREAPPKPSCRPAGRSSSADRSREEGARQHQVPGEYRQDRTAGRIRTDPSGGRRESAGNPSRDPGQVQLRSGMRLWYISGDRKSCSMITVQQVFPASQELTVVTGGNTLKLSLSVAGERFSIGCPRKEDNGLYVPDRAYQFALMGRPQKEKMRG